MCLGSVDSLCVPAVTEGIVGAVLGMREVRERTPFCDPVLKAKHALITHTTLLGHLAIFGALGKLMVIQYHIIL